MKKILILLIMLFTLGMKMNAQYWIPSNNLTTSTSSLVNFTIPTRNTNSTPAYIYIYILPQGLRRNCKVSFISSFHATKNSSFVPSEDGSDGKPPFSSKNLHLSAMFYGVDGALSWNLAKIYIYCSKKPIQ